jgi:hypothetical protein
MGGTRLYGPFGPQMDEKHPYDVLTGHALSEPTRLERRSLLAVSAIGIVVKWKAIFSPGINVSAYGLSFSMDHEFLLRVIGLIDAYLLIVFATSALTDFSNWRHRLRGAISKHLDSTPPSGSEAIGVGIDHAFEGLPVVLEAERNVQRVYFDRYQENRVSFTTLALTLAPSSVPKIFFDFLFPVLLGVPVLVCLLPMPWVASGALVCYVCGTLLAYLRSRERGLRSWRAVFDACRWPSVFFRR